MRFFYPGAATPREALEQWKMRRASVETRDTLHDAKIWRIKYSYDGERCVATVGENALAIFEGDTVFYVCTHDRPGGIIVGRKSDPTIEVQCFDQELAPKGE